MKAAWMLLANEIEEKIGEFLEQKGPDSAFSLGFDVQGMISRSDLNPQEKKMTLDSVIGGLETIVRRLRYHSGRLFGQETVIESPAVGKHVNIPDEEFDPTQLAMGIEVEYEHTDDPDLAKEIAKDHLAECKDYYTRLKEMENECGHEHLE